MLEVDARTAACLDCRADDAADLRRGKRKALIGAFCTHREAGEASSVGDFCGARADVVDVALRAPRQRVVGDAAYPPQAAADLIPIGVRGEVDDDASWHRPYALDAGAPQAAADVVDQLADERRAVAALQRDLVIVDDDSVH